MPSTASNTQIPAVPAKSERPDTYTKERVLGERLLEAGADQFVDGEVGLAGQVLFALAVDGSRSSYRSNYEKSSTELDDSLASRRQCHEAPTRGASYAERPKQ